MNQQNSDIHKPEVAGYGEMYRVYELAAVNSASSQEVRNHRTEAVLKRLMRGFYNDGRGEWQRTVWFEQWGLTLKLRL